MNLNYSKGYFDTEIPSISLPDTLTPRLSDVCLYRGTEGGFLEGVCTPSSATANLHDPPPPPPNSRIARDSVILSDAVSYTRSARTIRRFWKVGIGVHVCNVTTSLPLTCPITQTSVGSVINTSLTRYL
jgi:hypothetical protein